VAEKSKAYRRENYGRLHEDYHDLQADISVHINMVLDSRRPISEYVGGWRK
jgi:hypothetical protein